MRDVTSVLICDLINMVGKTNRAWCNRGEILVLVHAKHDRLASALEYHVELEHITHVTAHFSLTKLLYCFS